MSRIGCVLLAVGLAVSALAVPESQSQSKGVIKIASQSPLSGSEMTKGEGIKLGAQLALDKLKRPLEKMGYKVELAPFDDQGRPDVGVSNAKTIVADKDILAVIGHLNSGVALPSSEVYRDANLVMISPGNTATSITDRKYPNVNRVCGRDDVQGRVGSAFAWRVLKARSVYILHDKTPYGEGVVAFFKADAEKKGMKVLGFEGTDEKTSFDPLITRLTAKKPDLVYFGGLYPQAGEFFKQARAKGVTAQFMGPDGMDSSGLTRIAGKAVVGLHYTSAAAPASTMPKAKTFVEEFKRAFGKSPEPYAAEAYDATGIALRAIEQAARSGKVTRHGVAAEVRKAKYEGITGDIGFDPNGDRLRAPYFVLVVATDDPDAWSDNRIVATVHLPATGEEARPRSQPGQRG